jgi:hypothetical protein
MSIAAALHLCGIGLQCRHFYFEIILYSGDNRYALWFLSCWLIALLSRTFIWYRVYRKPALSRRADLGPQPYIYTTCQSHARQT